MLKTGIYRVLFLIIFMMSAHVSHACINVYGANLFFVLDGQPDPKTLQVEIQQLERQLAQTPQDYKKQNDYAVLKLLAGEYAHAIQILQKIEQQHPGLAITAANLGTAYELNGQFKEALHWIEQDIKRDPALHHGTEWMHVKILLAKIKQQQDTAWLERHHVLDVDFGKQLLPQPSAHTITAYPDRTYTLDEAYTAIRVQFDERLKFVTPPDSVVGDLSQFMGDFELYRFNQEEAFWLYETAKKAGVKNLALLEQRKQAIQNHEFEKQQYRMQKYVRQIGWPVLTVVALTGLGLTGLLFYSLSRLIRWWQVRAVKNKTDE